MNSLTPSFDENIFYIGSICKRGHDWENTGYSLRYKSTQSCIECRKFHHQEYVREGRIKQYYQNGKEKSSERKKARYKASPEKFRLERKIYRESNREKISEQRKQSYKKHRDKNIERVKINYEKNKEKIKRQQAERYLKNPVLKEKKLQANRKRKAIRKGNHHFKCSHIQLKERMILFDGCCAYCGIESNQLTLDHFLPVSFNGPDCLGNYLPACGNCNNNKKNKDPKEWFKSKPFYSNQRWKKS